MSKYTAKMENLWGEDGKSFIRVPFGLLKHFLDIGLTSEDLPVVLWIIKHQWSEKAAFPHPAKLAIVLHISTAEAVQRLYSLQERGFITLEATKNGSGNYHQDLRPLRNKLREYIKHHKGIDVSVNKNQLSDVSIQKDASILKTSDNRGGTASIDMVLSNRYKSEMKDEK